MSMIQEGDRSPWGTVDFAKRLGPQVTLVGTPAHGGLHMGPLACTAIPPEVSSTFIQGCAWAEEDCEAIIALAILQDASFTIRHGEPKTAEDAGWVVERAIVAASQCERYSAALPVLEAIKSRHALRLQFAATPSAA